MPSSEDISHKKQQYDSVMSTSMPTDEAKDWGSELRSKGWYVDGIELEDEDTMRDIYEDLEIQDDTKVHRKRRTGLRAYIKKQQASGKKSFIPGSFIVDFI